MGLAELLKRRLEGAQGGKAKRARAAKEPSNGTAKPPSAAAPLALGPPTRTALRKQRKAAAAAAEAAKAERKRLRNAPPPVDSDAEDAAALEADLAAAGDKLAGSRSAAYDALLGSLRRSGGGGGDAAFAAAYDQRQREQAGDSDGGESADDDEEGSEGDGGDEEEEDLSSLGSDDEGEDGSLLDGEEEAAAGLASDDDDGAEGGSGSGSGGSDDGEGGGESDSSGSEGEEEAGGAATLAGRSNGAAAGPSVAAAPEDHYASHFGRQLSEGEVAALAAGGGGRLAPAEGAAAAGLRQWGAAELVASPGAALPAAPAELAAYGVKERLASRWREVHAAEHAPAAEAGAAGDFSSGAQRALFALANSYADVLLPCRQYPTEIGTADGWCCLLHRAGGLPLAMRRREGHPWQGGFPLWTTPTLSWSMPPRSKNVAPAAPRC